jgi:hypothetical protein
MVYLIHFAKYYKRAGHYLGYSADEKFAARIHHHKKNRGAALIRAVNNAGIKWKVVRQWPNEDGHFERKLKNKKKASLLCPVCTMKQILTNAKKIVMCYDKANNNFYKNQEDPVAFLKAMYFDMIGAKEKLSKIKEQPLYENIFSAGERTSIEHMLKKLEDRMTSIKDLQRQFE